MTAASITVVYKLGASWELPRGVVILNEDSTPATGIAGVAQASTTSGQTGPLMQGAVTTSAPTYTTAKTNPLSLDTSGHLRVAPINGQVGIDGGSGASSAKTVRIVAASDSVSNVLGSRPFVVKGTTTNQAVSYASGEVIGPLIAISTGLTAGTIITAATLRVKTLGQNITAAGSQNLYFFDANPTGSTISDKVALAIVAADVSKTIFAGGGGAWSTTATGAVGASTTAMPRITVGAAGVIWLAIIAAATTTFANADILSYEIDGTY